MQWTWITQYKLISSPWSDSPLPTTECLQATASVSLLQFTFPATILSLFKLDLKERSTTNEIKHKPAQTAAVYLLPNKFHATANVGLLARLQNLSTATLSSRWYNCGGAYLWRRQDGLLGQCRSKNCRCGVNKTTWSWTQLRPKSWWTSGGKNPLNNTVTLCWWCNRCLDYVEANVSCECERKDDIYGRSARGGRADGGHTKCRGRHINTPVCGLI